MVTPRRIGRYEIKSLLGSGAMGQVWLGRDPDLDRDVAVKTVRDHGLPRETLDVILARFRNEARAGAKLHHPNIVAVYDVGEDAEAGPYLVLEYVDGVSLKTLLRDAGPLSPENVMSVTRDLSRALDVAHAAGVIHRDIKPDNLLVVRKEGAIVATKLADFGVAKLPDAEMTREGQFLGTPCYAAPETLDRGEYGSHTDVFSFGAVLYEAVSGTRAYPGDDAVSVAHKVLHDTPARPSSVKRAGAQVPPAVDDVIMGALSREPRDRPRSAGELSRELRAAYGASGVVQLPPRADESQSTPPPPRREARSGAWLFVAVIVVGLAAAIGLVVMMGGGDAGADTPTDAGVDAAPIDAGAAALGTVDATLDDAMAMHGLPDGSTLIATSSGAPDAGGVVPPAIDAGAAAHAADSGVPVASPDGVSPTDAELAALTAGQREDAAKDAVARARAALARRDVTAARSALAAARRYDPGNSDLDTTETAIRSLDSSPPRSP